LIDSVFPEPKGDPAEAETCSPCNETSPPVVGPPLGSGSNFSDMPASGGSDTKPPSSGAWSVRSFLMPSAANLVWRSPCQNSRRREGTAWASARDTTTMIVMSFVFSTARVANVPCSDGQDASDSLFLAGLVTKRSIQVLVYRRRVHSERHHVSGRQSCIYSFGMRNKVD